MDTDDLVTGSDGVTRCWWCVEDAEYRRYHDEEWGRPVHDDRRLFEKLCLEAFQAGLSWLTILRKREAFRTAFNGFDPATVANYGPEDVERLLNDESIVRNRAKIEATVDNAGAYLSLVEDVGSFSEWIWDHAPEQHPVPTSREDLPAETEASRELSRDLKDRGFTFVGPTTSYAFMQAMGLVDDHLAGCDLRGD